MGRAKKHAAEPVKKRRPPPRTAPPPATATEPEATESEDASAAQRAQLARQLAAVKAELQRLHLEGDADKIATSMLVAGLTQRLWALESLLAESPDLALAMSRQAAAWGEQHVRAAKAMTADLLRELFAKAEAMERHQGQIRGLK